MNDSAIKRFDKKWQRSLFLLMIVIGGFVGYLVYNRDGDEAPQGDEQSGLVKPEGDRPKLTTEQVVAACELRDESLGHLENGPSQVEVNGRSIGGMELAADGFERLAELLPGELLPVQNLAIARLLILRNAQENALDQARVMAQAAAQRFMQMAPESAVSHWLAALVQLQQDPGNPNTVNEEAREQALTLLQEATRLDPDNVVFWYALKMAATDQRAATPSALAISAMEKAYSLDPRNIYLITEWLTLQTVTQDPAVEKTLAAAKEVLKPLGASVKRRSRIELGEQIDKAVQAARVGNWSLVNTSVRIIQNVVRPEEVAKSDIASVDVHPLAFVLFKFSSKFDAQYGEPMPTWKESTAVKLRIRADDALAELVDVVAFRVMDFTLNGLPDLLVLQPGKLSVLSRPAAEQPWTVIARIDVPAGMTGVLAADLDRDRRKSLSAPSAERDGDDDNVAFDQVVSETESCHDADPDIVLFGEHGALVIRNDLDAQGDAPKLVRVENEGLTQLTDVSTGALFDLDHDGELDLVFSSARGVTLWGSGAALTYTNISEFSQMPPADVPVTSMVAVDWDRDADTDVVMGEPSGKVVGLLENLRHGEFRWKSFDSDYQQLDKPESVALLEADGNMSWDLLAAGANGVHLYLTVTPRSGIVNFLQTHVLTDQAQAGVLAWDFDNDGFRDAASWGIDGLHVFRGGPKGTYVAAPVVEGELADVVHAASCIDMERDGDQDLVVATPSGMAVLVNEGGNRHQWLTLYPVGQSDNKGRCNHHAIGSLVELRAGGWYQAQVVDSPTVHFGLGTEKEAQQLRIVWTNGVPQNIVDLAGNVAICELMVLKGSCPYVYTMAGGEFSFFTDCLWAAPIGMQTSEGTIAPTRSWEYLFVPGERLTAHEGSYWIKMTEELWEAGYFDKVQLIAIDHPGDVEIYSNEKVGPAEIAEFKIHTVRHRRFPTSVVDQRGRDLAAKLRKRDGDFVKAFEQRIRQGLTPGHFLEMDLGRLEDPKEITLLLTGWIFPTDTSLNMAFFQDPETDGPRMPSVWVKDVDGQWKETIAYMGFPGGKTKTIAVDLSHAFLTTDYHVRIKTTAEIYWDEVFFTVDEPEVEFRQTPLELQSAELAYRGFSHELLRRDEVPQLYDYGKVRRTPNWPPMRGRFTRYGSVRELIAEGDDMMAVLGAGDAMTMRFAVPSEEPPAGWKRDFILHSIGWDKDADLNTIYGQTVEPLPFRAMQSYPFDADDLPPDSPAYRAYLRRYQTREQDPQAFWRWLQLD